MKSAAVLPPSKTQLAQGTNYMQLESPKILVVDDNLFSRMTTVDLLALEGYRVVEADSTYDILDFVSEQNPDLILLELFTKGPINGFEVCQRLKEDKRTCLIPVIFTTVNEERDLRLKCFDSGGDDILSKPLDQMILTARVKSLIRQKRLNESLDQTEQVLYSIGRTIRSRYYQDTKSALHLADWAKAFAEYLELSPSEIDNLVCAAHLHDIGTVLIPDAVMLKKESLTATEREILKQHVLIGEEICQPLKNRRGVLAIIRHHHEKWDGSGYPDGLKGEEIPRLAQVFQILDIYYALTSERRHRKALTPKQALDIIQEESENGWRNPEIVAEFTTFIQNHGKYISKWKQAS